MMKPLYAVTYHGRRFVREARAGRRFTHAAIYRHPTRDELDATFHTSERHARRARHYYWRDRRVEWGHAFPWVAPCAVLPVEVE